MARTTRDAKSPAQQPSSQTSSLSSPSSQTQSQSEAEPPPPLTYEVLTSDDAKRDALQLVADSIAQQRQVASLAVIFHPACFVAVVVGLGAMFGALLEAGGGVEAIANRLLARFGEKRALWALTAIGVVVGVPLFFDVALIILAPLLCALTLRSKRPIVWFALPTLAGLAVMHALLPPHPGPVAAAELLKADYGQIALWGFVCGLPAVLVAGPFYAWIAYRKQGQEGYVLPPSMDTGMPRQATIGFGVALTAMLAPL
ncbi:MAG TPA: SLC13 family permease, partial [Caulobacter sp.]|nr:SLC13 family permease [Caulobacter sp.]